MPGVNTFTYRDFTYRTNVRIKILLFLIIRSCHCNDILCVFYIDV